jgi:TatD DNase family protein
MKTLTEIFALNTLIDSHCHCTSIGTELRAIITDAKTQGVNYIVDCATDLSTSAKTYANYLEFPDTILPAAGLHPELLIPGSDLYRPEYDAEMIRTELAELEKLVSGTQYFALGECGLDFYWLEKGDLTLQQKEHVKKLQKLLFQGQIDLALKYELPLTIHSRASEDACLEMLKPFAHKAAVIFHSFTGNYDQAKQILDLGFKLGVNGIITYKSARELREVYKKIIGVRKFSTPLELYDQGIYLETDAPLLLPANTVFHDSFNTPKQIKCIWDYFVRFFNNGQEKT